MYTCTINVKCIYTYIYIYMLLARRSWAEGSEEHGYSNSNNSKASNNSNNSNNNNNSNNSDARNNSNASNNCNPGPQGLRSMAVINITTSIVLS